MAEVLVDFDAELRGPDGKSYRARACGREGERGRWQGWIEFVRSDGSGVVRTGRETTQRNREELLYWAEGLTETYLDGALRRALSPYRPRSHRREPARRPAFEGPAPEGFDSTAAATLDPFTTYAHGREVLRKGLAGLDKSTLRKIIRAHRLSAATSEELARLTREQLAGLIVRCVEERGG